MRVVCAWCARGVRVVCAWCALGVRMLSTVCAHPSDAAVVGRLEVAAAADLPGVVGLDELIEYQCQAGHVQWERIEHLRLRTRRASHPIAHTALGPPDVELVVGSKRWNGTTRRRGARGTNVRAEGRGASGEMEQSGDGEDERAHVCTGRAERREG